MQRARVLERLGDHSGALRDLDRAERAVADLSDSVLAARSVATVDTLRAELHQKSEARRALQEIDSAIGYFRRAASAGRLARLLILRSRCLRAAGDTDGAARDLEAAIEAFDADRACLSSPQDLMQAFELECTAISELVHLELVDRHHEAAALQIAEHGRSQTLMEG